MPLQVSLQAARMDSRKYFYSRSIWRKSLDIRPRHIQDAKVGEAFWYLLHYLTIYLVRSKKTSGNDSKFFTTNRKGENHELREELRSPIRDRKRDAVKKVRQLSIVA